jgi:gluconate 2-dehydrogenase gamma chain
MSSDDGHSSRRDFLTGVIALGPAVVTLAAGASLESAGREAPLSGAPAPNQPAADDYRPTFFTPAEWLFINAACARLIPADEHGPGAIDTGVPQYIDRQMSTPWAEGASWYMQGPFFEAPAEFGYQSQLTPKQQFRLGIRAIDRLCQEHLGQAFAGLTSTQQDDVLHQIEKGSLDSPEIHLTTFFSSFLLKYVMEGYFCDPMYGGNKDMAAWKMIGHPGARADYLDWVGESKPYPYGPVGIYGEHG